MLLCNGLSPEVKFGVWGLRVLSFEFWMLDLGFWVSCFWLYGFVLMF